MTNTETPSLNRAELVATCVREALARLHHANGEATPFDGPPWTDIAGLVDELSELAGRIDVEVRGTSIARTESMTSESAIDQPESLASWVARNLANCERRASLVAEEGKLLLLLAELAGRQEENDAGEQAAYEAVNDAFNIIDEDIIDEAAEAHYGQVDAGLDLNAIELALLDRLCPNQDEQQRLLEDLVEELSPEQEAKREAAFALIARDEQDAMPRRGRLQLRFSASHAEREEARRKDARDRSERLVGRLLEGDKSAWDSAGWSRS